MEAETLELVELNHLDEEEMAEAREAALALDERAYDEAPDVWEDTAPAEAPTDEAPVGEPDQPVADEPAPAPEPGRAGGPLPHFAGGRSGLFDLLSGLLAGRF